VLGKWAHWPQSVFPEGSLGLLGLPGAPLDLSEFSGHPWACLLGFLGALLGLLGFLEAPLVLSGFPGAPVGLSEFLGAPLGLLGFPGALLDCCSLCVLSSPRAHVMLYGKGASFHLHSLQGVKSHVEILRAEFF
jgi:hypothetical protein